MVRHVTSEINRETIDYMFPAAVVIEEEVCVKVEVEPGDWAESKCDFDAPDIRPLLGSRFPLITGRFDELVKDP